MTYILQKKNSFKYISQFDRISLDVFVPKAQIRMSYHQNRWWVGALQVTFLGMWLHIYAEIKGNLCQ